MFSCSELSRAQAELSINSTRRASVGDQPAVLNLVSGLHVDGKKGATPNLAAAASWAAATSSGS